MLESACWAWEAGSPLPRAVAPFCGPQVLHTARGQASAIRDVTRALAGPELWSGVLQGARKVAPAGGPALCQALCWGLHR